MHRNQLSVFHLTIRFSKIGSMTIITLVVTMSTITTVAKKKPPKELRPPWKP